MPPAAASPIVAPSTPTGNRNNPRTMNRCDDDWTLNCQIINLQRLLYCMTQKDKLRELVEKRGVNEVIHQVQYAQSLLRLIEDGVMQQQKSGGQVSAENVKALGDEVHNVCLHANEYVKSCGEEPVGGRRDIIDDIFFTSIEDEEEDEEEEMVEVPEENEDDCEIGSEDFDTQSADYEDVDAHDMSCTAQEYASASRIINEEAHRAQEDMQHTLELEIAEMASHLKQSFEAMNENLKEQNANMDDMAELTESLQSGVTDVTHKVEDRNRKHGWLKTLSTWSLLFVITGSFIFMVFMMRTIPKRPEACIFFCSNKQTTIKDDSTIMNFQQDDILSCKSGNCLEMNTVIKLENEKVEGFSDSIHRETLNIAPSENKIDDGSNNDSECSQEESENFNKVGDNDGLDESFCTAKSCEDAKDDLEDEYVHTVTEEQYSAAEMFLKMREAVLRNDPNSLDEYLRYAPISKTALHSSDVNGWQLVHEAARFGHVEVMQILNEHGGNLSAKTPQGWTPLLLAQNKLSQSHPMNDYLKMMDEE